MSLTDELRPLSSVYIRQKRELAELIGFETRNKYAIESEDGRAIGFAAEQQKGVLGFLFRQFLGHWRPFEIHFFDSMRQLTLRTVHPFRFLFQRLEIFLADGTKVGAIQQRFAILSKRFDFEDSMGQVTMSVSSPVWRIWTFPIIKRGQTVGVIEKKWTGLLTEAFTDKDQFRIQFSEGQDLADEEKLLILASGLFVDLKYFEAKAR